MCNVDRSVDAAAVRAVGVIGERGLCVTIDISRLVAAIAPV